MSCHAASRALAPSLPPEHPPWRAAVRGLPRLRAREGWGRLALIGATLTVLAACRPPEAPPMLTPLAAPNKLQAAEPRVNSAIPGNRNLPTSFEAHGATVEPALATQPGGSATQGGDIALNFVDTDIREIARVILGETLKLNYTIDPGVQGTATLDIGKPVPRATLLSMFETLLNQNGATLVERGGIYRVMPAGGGAALANAAAPGAVGSATQIVSLRFASAQDLAKLIEPYVGEGGKITADPGRNALLVSGPETIRRTLIDMVRALGRHPGQACR